MTDKEIIRALECYSCETIMYCEDQCPFYKKCMKDEQLSKYALDLITRKQAEIIRLQSMNQAKLDTIHDLQAEIESLKVENQSLRSAANSLKMHYEETQAEIDKLNAENMLTMAERNAFYTSFYELLKQLKTAKSEAIKEFAERLKEETLTTDKFGEILLVQDIDNLVKEIIGE